MAKECRSACGVAVSGRPSAPRSRAIASWTTRAESGPPLAPTNRGPSLGQVVWAEREVVADQFGDLWQHRDHALLATLACYGDGSGARRNLRVQAERLGNPQAAAVEQASTAASRV